MEHKTFFYDSRLLAMANKPYTDVCNLLGSPLHMIASDAINEYINYYTYNNRYEVKFFYRVYYIGSVFISSIYDHGYFSENYNKILRELSNNTLPDVYKPIISKIKLSDLVETEEDGETSKKDKENKDISEEILSLYSNSGPIIEDKDSFDEMLKVEDEESTSTSQRLPIRSFNTGTQFARNELWKLLPIEYKMDLIKNCIVIDALNNYSLS